MFSPGCFTRPATVTISAIIGYRSDSYTCFSYSLRSMCNYAMLPNLDRLQRATRSSFIPIGIMPHIQQNSSSSDRTLTQGRRESELVLGHNFGAGPSDMFSSNCVIVYGVTTKLSMLLRRLTRFQEMIRWMFLKGTLKVQISQS